MSKWADPDTIREALAMLVEGHTATEVGRVVGYSSRQVYQWAQRNRLNPEWPESRPQRILEGRPHGRRGTYKRGCRCRPCRDSEAAYWRAVNRRKILTGGRPLISSVGASRRIGALYSLGWTARHISDACGVPVRTLWNITGRNTLIQQSTHDAIKVAYAKLSMRVGPSRNIATRARGLGWAPPLAWDDETIDDPDATPEGVGYSPGRGRGNAYDLPDVETIAAETNDRSLTDVAARYGVAVKTLHKRLARAGYVNVAGPGLPARYVRQEAA